MFFSSLSALGANVINRNTKSETQPVQFIVEHEGSIIPQNTVQDEDEKDVAPKWAIHLLMLAWLVLIGGRWVLTPAIMFGDSLTSATAEKYDRGILLQVYLVLLVLTLLIPAMRFARSLESKSRKAGTSNSSG